MTPLKENKMEPIFLVPSNCFSSIHEIYTLWIYHVFLVRKWGRLSQFQGL